MKTMKDYIAESMEETRIADDLRDALYSVMKKHNCINANTALHVKLARVIKHPEADEKTQVTMQEMEMLAGSKIVRTLSELVETTGATEPSMVAMNLLLHSDFINATLTEEGADLILLEDQMPVKQKASTTRK